MFHIQFLARMLVHYSLLVRQLRARFEVDVDLSDKSTNFFPGFAHPMSCSFLIGTTFTKYTLTAILNFEGGHYAKPIFKDIMASGSRSKGAGSGMAGMAAAIPIRYGGRHANPKFCMATTYQSKVKRPTCLSFVTSQAVTDKKKHLLFICF